MQPMFKHKGFHFGQIDGKCSLLAEQVNSVLIPSILPGKLDRPYDSPAVSKQKTGMFLTAPGTLQNRRTDRGQSPREDMWVTLASNRRLLACGLQNGRVRVPDFHFTLGL